MSLVPLMGGEPATPPAAPADALAPGEEVLRGDAVALGPEVTGEALVAGVAAIPEDALPVVVPEDARAQLARLKMQSWKIDRVVQAARAFNDQVADGRSIDALTLGLLWSAEGGARLDITLDPNMPGFGPNHRNRVQQLIDLRLDPPDTLRAWRITNIGLWGFGLDDIFGLDGGGLAEFEFAASTTRWKRRLRDHAHWVRDVPFLNASGTTTPPVVTTMGPVGLSYSAAEAVGFLIATAARFTRQLWLLPAELAARGIVLGTDSVEQIPLREPILAYMCYLQRAQKAAALWEALLFLSDLSNGVSLAKPAPSERDTGYHLSFVIDALNRWLGALRVNADMGLMSILDDLVKDSTARTSAGRAGRDVLVGVATRTDWNPIPAEASIDEAGRTLLVELVDAWSVFADRLALVTSIGGVPLPPGELFFQGADDAVSPLLFPNQLGTTGFGARNYGQRFRTATQLPLGAPCRRVQP